MKIKYQWPLLKDEYIRGNWPAISSFFKEKRLPNTSYTREKSKGWGIEKVAYIKKVISETQVLSVKSGAEIRLRQAMLSQELQAKGMEGLLDLPVDNCETARKLVVDGLEFERRSLGLDCQNDINSTNINQTSPASELDKQLAEMPYEDILQLIAEVKREKANRRSGTVPGDSR